MFQVGCRRPSVRRSGFDSDPEYIRLMVKRMALGQVFLRTIQLSLFGDVVLQPHAHLSVSNTFICRTNWRNLGTFGYR